MVKPIIFFIFVFILIGILYIKPTEEGFANSLGYNWNSKNSGTPSVYNNNKDKVQSLPVAQLGVGSIQPSPPPVSDLPSAPSGFQSKESPNPYRNPTLEPAKYIRILAVKEDIQAFFGFQANNIQNSSDPSIQIPLTRARADLSELITVQSVMERNPGLSSRINSKQLDDIVSNLKYLKDIASDLESNALIKEGFQSQSNTRTKPKRPSPRATMKDLKGFQTKLSIELKRLQASGTSDPLTKMRISNLTIIKNDIDDVIKKLQTGFYKPNTVPIFKSDIDKSLPLLGNLNKPLPKLLKKFNLNPAITNLFPGGLSPRDNEQAAQINNILKGYMKSLSEGVSWGVNVNVQYDNPNKYKNSSRSSRSSRASMSTRNKVSGIPGLEYSNDLNITGAKNKKSTNNTKPPLDYKTSNQYSLGLPGTSNFRTFPNPVSGSLDWKKRSSQIVSQIRKRGLDPKQFGAMPENVEVSNDFSWRGYTRMLCSRLNTTTDPGLSVTVGCPPENWLGWRQ
jgi:hypothetical protein